MQPLLSPDLTGSDLEFIDQSLEGSGLTSQYSYKQHGRKVDGVLVTPLDASSRNKDSYDITAISS